MYSGILTTMARRVAIERGRRPPRDVRPLAGWLLAGAAVVGLPALANALVRRRVAPPRAALWGRSHRFEWDLGEVAFQELGSGPALLAIHSIGPGHDGGEWRRAAEALAADHRVLVPDLLGFGASGALPAGAGPEVYVALLADFLAEVVREPALLVAAGLSATWAVRLAAERPELVTGLVLVVPAGLGDPDGARDGAGHASRAFLARLLGVPVFGTSALNLLTSRAALERHLRRLYAAPERVDAALVDHHWRSSHLPTARAALGAWISGRLGAPVEPALGDLRELRELRELRGPRVPVAIAWGRLAVEPPVEAADLWLRRLPGARLEVFEGCGGLPHAEAPARFASAVRAFERDLS